MFKDLSQEELSFIISQVMLDGLMFTTQDFENERIIASLVRKGYIEEVYQGYYPYYVINPSKIDLPSLLNSIHFPMSVSDTSL